MSRTAEWIAANQRYLAAAVVNLRALIEGTPQSEQTIESCGDHPFALDVVAATFGLSPFERNVLVLCAAVELDSTVASLCTPTFSLALSVLPEAHWSAITPAAPLRRWRLIELGGGPVTAAPLRVDERVLHFLAGVDQLDERVAGALEPLVPRAALAPTHDAAAARIAALWTASAERNERFAPLQLCAFDAATRREIAAAACATVGLNAYVMSAVSLPHAPTELDLFIRLVERESWLGRAAVLFECETLEDGPRAEAARQFAARAGVPLLVGAREPRSQVAPAAAVIDVPRLDAAEQRAVWLESLGDAAARIDGELDRVTAQFVLPPERIRGVAASVRATDDPARALWTACRTASRTRMDELARRIETRAAWEDLVLPDAQRAVLDDLVTCVRYRTRVYDEWQFAARDTRGLSVTALFSGPSGTGKTLAAEVIARALDLDLYRIDLSGVVSKYIGETEKNLRRLFDAAEESGAILLFDEADALFGRRSEVRDSHDRYANIEVSYLLQRMEAYRGVAILTTNSREALDPAFLRRLRYIVHFPFPGPVERLAIWRRMFPDALPVEGVDAEKLARLPVAGGNIRNIAVNAAFSAARDASPMRMRHLLDAARAEYAKLEKTLPAADVEGWA